MIPAPKIDPNKLWAMPDEAFNDWREKNDYPRIISFLKEKQPEFDEWMAEMQINDDVLIKYMPSTFLRDHPFVYLYGVLHKGEEEREILSTKKYEKTKFFFTKTL